MDKIAKAVAGAITGGLTAALTALGDGHVTATEWVLIALAAVGTGGAVWATPNAAAEAPKP